MAGTFGAVVTKAGKRFILSNNHVLAENGLISLGAPIFQPGLLDGGKPYGRGCERMRARSRSS